MQHANKFVIPSNHLEGVVPISGAAVVQILIKVLSFTPQLTVDEPAFNSHERVITANLSIPARPPVP